MRRRREKSLKIQLPATINAGSGEIGNENLPEILEDDFMKLQSSRRNFLKAFGYSFASAALLSACRRPVIRAIPYADQPPEITPGQPLFYASSFFDGHEYCSIIVKTREGRPIKIEGNPLSGFNGEGTTARVQASVLSLYDDARIKNPTAAREKISWEELDRQVTAALVKINNDGKEIILLTSTIISPSTKSLIDEFGKGFAKFRWVQYDPVSYSAVLEANMACFGKAVMPDYNFQNAELVVSVNADFLGTWVSPVHFIPKYVAQRKLNGKMNMLRHIQYESGLSLTGSNADIRHKIKPSEEKILLKDLYNRIAGTAPEQAFRDDLSELAKSLLASKGKSILVSGTNDSDIQIIVNGINLLLGNYGSCIDLGNPLNLASGIDSRMEAFVNDLNDGKVGALLMYNVNPAYDYYDPEKFLAGLKKTSLSINMPAGLNETVGEAGFECPVNHYLESWDDAEVIPGQLSLTQPCINNLFDTRSFQDSLLKWSGKEISWHDYLVARWEKEYFPASGLSDFRNFWNQSLSKGIFNFRNEEKTAISIEKEVLAAAMQRKNEAASEDFEVIFNESIAMGTGMHSNNPWLMELPDPVARQSWENVAALSPADAEKLAIKTGQVVKIGNLSIPALVQPGQAEGTISIALGYGHFNAGHVADKKGVNVYPLAGFSGRNRKYGFNASLSGTSDVTPLALVQMHSSMEGRPIVRDTVLGKYRQNQISGNEVHKEFESMHKSLYPDWEFDGFHWAIAIDLNACVGCHTCVIACQAENNSPTVGKDQVMRQRIMHWIKIHRYYSEDHDNPRVYFQPVFCQQCDNAPCENVCPVSATNHSSEGLNQMTYNRCVGTKYCMNNCPYRVRRFNWYRYTNNKKAYDYNSASDLGKMVLNPDVTVRERGVVEKCTFCVQRIQAKKLEAKIENRVLKDNEIKTACMQACPAGAIIFGDLNDPQSRVSLLFRDPRRYHLLEELHTLPSIGFLTKVWNYEI